MMIKYALYKTILAICCLLFFHFLSVKSIAQGCNDTAYNFILTNNQPFQIFDQLTTASGNNVYCGRIGDGLPQSSALIFCNNNKGDLQWAKSFANVDIVFTHFDKVKELRDGSFIITGRSIENDNAIEYMLIAKFTATGSLLWHRFYKPDTFQYETTIIRSQQIIEDSDGGLYFSFYTSSYNFSTVAKLDASGNLRWSQSFRYNGLLDPYAIAFTPIFISGDTLNITGFAILDHFTMKLNRQTGSLLSVNRYPLRSPSLPFASFDPQNVLKVFPLANGNFIVCTRLMYAFPAEYFFVEFNRSMEIVTSFTLNLPVPMPLSVSFSILIKPDGTGIFGAPVVGLSSWPFSDKFYMAVFNSSHKTVVQKKLKFNRTDYTFGAFQNSSLVGVDNDGQIRLTPTFGGPLSASFGMDCYFFKLNFEQGNQCIIEADTMFASLSDISLTAVPFSFDRIEDNVLETINHPVNVSDAVFIRQEVCQKVSICEQIKIKGEQTICLNDKPVEFIASKSIDCLRKVIWQIDNKAADSTKIINDSTFHIYFGREWKGKIYALLEGCNLKDSIEVQVGKNIPKVFWGVDTGFCVGDSVLLNANPGYLSYLWNNGETSKSIVSKKSGQYSVIAERPDGCFDTDTIQILPLYQPSVFSLADNPVLCIGQNDTLSPGSGFVSYTWQDGSSKENLVVTQQKTYWVNVVDTNGCKAGDTILVSGLRSPPEDFIFSDTAICQYETITLKPIHSFSSYLWNTGATSPVLQINRPATYSLEVRDSFNCIGKQNIQVKTKPCSNSIYFPSAFTPNGDGKNDLFRPVVNGELATYHLQVFNKWGENIFETDNPIDAWSGQFFSTSQPAGTFVWQAKYQFAGESLKFVKGTVVLIR